MVVNVKKNKVILINVLLKLLNILNSVIWVNVVEFILVVVLIFCIINWFEGNLFIILYCLVIRIISVVVV